MGASRLKREAARDGGEGSLSGERREGERATTGTWEKCSVGIRICMEREKMCCYIILRDVLF